MIESRHGSQTLADRILDSFPSGSYAITALLRLVDVIESDLVETAAVECVAAPRLLINPSFIAEHCPTSDTLLMLVMHELHHVLLGHTRQFPRVTVVHNLVFDAVINAMLCRMFPEPSCTSFFTRLYEEDRFPDCLLRPATGWTPDLPDADIPVPPALQGQNQRRAATVYRALYSPTGASYDDLYGILVGKISKRQAAAVLLLGDHAERLEDGSESEVMFEILGQVTGHWPESPDPVQGRSLGELMDSSLIRTRRPPPSNRKRLRELIRQVGGLSGRAWLTESWQTEEMSVQGPLPSFDRRSVVLRSLGWPPLLYANPISRRRKRQVPDGERVHVYVDVSGSIGNLKGALYGAVLDCREMVDPRVHLFSTEVADVSFAELKRGVCHTTCGTSIECVARHMKRYDVRRTVLITDGFVGSPESGSQRTLENARLGVALTEDYGRHFGLEGVTDFWTTLDLENTKETK